MDSYLLNNSRIDQVVYSYTANTAKATVVISVAFKGNLVLTLYDTGVGIIATQNGSIPIRFTKGIILANVTFAPAVDQTAAPSGSIIMEITVPDFTTSPAYRILNA